MRFRTWWVAALGLAGLLLLVVYSVLTASRSAQDIFTQLDDLNTHHRSIETKIRRLRSDVNLSAITIRDYLLDPNGEPEEEYRRDLHELRDSSRRMLQELQQLEQPDAWGERRLPSLQAKLEDYWRAYDPIFEWSRLEKLTRSAEFLRQEVVPRREAVHAMARELEALNNANLAAQRIEVTRQHTALRRDLHALLWQSVLLGALVAIVAVLRLRALEGKSEEQRGVAQEAERQLRELSQQLVAAQEEERRKLSRELHDHVGQMLTALRMELGRIERLRPPGGAKIGEAIVASRGIVDDMVRTVRDLALGLRPSMLDDFGLQPALEWHVRDYMRRYGLDVDLTIQGDFGDVPEPYRTAVYRTVQEALTNCARHSRATRVTLTLTADADAMQVIVQDNGIGMDPARRRNGLGLRGIEERVRELQGTMQIENLSPSGVRLAIRLPRPPVTSEVRRARVAG